MRGREGTPTGIGKSVVSSILREAKDALLRNCVNLLFFIVDGVVRQDVDYFLVFFFLFHFYSVT